MSKPLGKDEAYMEYTCRGPILDLSDMDEDMVEKAWRNEIGLVAGSRYVPAGAAFIGAVLVRQEDHETPTDDETTN